MSRSAVETGVPLLPEKVAVGDSAGVPYLEFRRSLRPVYWRLWVMLAVVDSALVGLVTAPAILGLSSGLWPGLAAAVGFALAIGFLQYLLSLLGHASGHGDLASDRANNDLLANVFVFSLTGLSVKAYRRVHFAHHRLLGRPGDPEDGYREPLDLKFLLRSLSGVRFLSAVARHSGGSDEPADGALARRIKASYVAAASLNVAALLVPFIRGAWYCSLGWALAFVIVTPSLNALRLVLEHRPAPGDVGVQGDAVTRCFRGRWMTSLFGAAGFRSHLVHHWDPQVHCTQLRHVEHFLHSTQAHDALLKATSSYHQTFIELATI